MTEKIKLLKLIESEKSLKEFISIPLEIKKSFALSKLIVKVTEQISAYNEARNNKVYELGEKKENWQVFVKNENLEEFMKQINELSEQEVELEIPEITTDDIKSKEIKTEILVNLNWLIKK